jgi:hypothetical protein
MPVAISRQNSRSTSLRSDGAPGDFIGDLPVNSVIHPAGLPIDTSIVEVLRRPVEFALYTPRLLISKREAMLAEVASSSFEIVVPVSVRDTQPDLRTMLSSEKQH